MLHSKLIKKLEPVYSVDDVGNKRSRNHKGQLHSFYDQPAIIYANGSKYWFKDGEHHRDKDLPATVHPGGDMEWWVNDQRHRDYGLPAEIRVSGYREWWINGRFIRSARV